MCDFPFNATMTDGGSGKRIHPYLCLSKMQHAVWRVFLLILKNKSPVFIRQDIVVQMIPDSF